MLHEIRAVPLDHPDAAALIARVQEFYVERYGGPDDDPMERSEFEEPDGAFFVGYRDGAPVSSGAWRRVGVPRLGMTRTAEIKRMYVVPEAARQGLGRQMLAHLESTARAAGFEALILATGARQFEAIALYESAGYQRIEPFGHYARARFVRCLGKVL